MTDQFQVQAHEKSPTVCTDISVKSLSPVTFAKKLEHQLGASNGIAQKEARQLDGSRTSVSSGGTDGPPRPSR